jgi:hypothetical protein
MLAWRPEPSTYTPRAFPGGPTSHEEWDSVRLSWAEHRVVDALGGSARNIWTVAEWDRAKEWCRKARTLARLSYPFGWIRLCLIGYGGVSRIEVAVCGPFSSRCDVKMVVLAVLRLRAAADSALSLRIKPTLGGRADRSGRGSPSERRGAPAGY